MGHAAAGETFPTIDPSTGEELTQIAAAQKEDVDRAVAAARTAFETSTAEWRREPPSSLVGESATALGTSWSRPS
jgi:acyl-CoA reductase-like NAD-dependent aldehyde dehydrogenase